MKKYLVVISLFVLTVSLLAQETKVPQDVQAAFKKLYPNVTEVKWDKEGSNQFEAEFTLKGVKTSVVFDEKGELEETETAIKMDELPSTVAPYMAKNYEGYEITEAAKIVDDEGNVNYEAEISQGKVKKDLLFDKDGNHLEKKSDKTEAEDNKTSDWTKSFNLDNADFSSTGENNYFILEPGYQLVLEGTEEGEKVRLVISVLDTTQKIGDVETRVVEEREMANGELVEVSRNFFAIDRKTADVFYFGEEVDIYENGKVISHVGAWRSDENHNHAGLMMPGKIRVGARYYQEVALEVAMDRSEIVDTVTVLDTPAGLFKNCLKTEETTPLEPDAREFKIYAPGIGLIKDENMLLIKFGFNIK